MPASRSARYAYGVLSGKEVPNTGPRGLLGRPVRFVHEGGLAAAVSEVDGPVPGRREDLLTHFDVLEELGARATVLPLRFGTVFDSEDDLVQGLLVRRGPPLERMLAEFDGMVELSVRAVYHRDEILSEIVSERRDIRRLRERTRVLPEDATYFDRIR